MTAKTPQEIEEEIVRMYTTPAEDGTWIGSNTIGLACGLSAHAVRAILQRNGIQIRSSKEACANGKQCKPVKNIPQGEAPACKCGCGHFVEWNRRKNKWNVYVEGHYRSQAPYKDRDWLYREYGEKHRTLADIGQAFGVAQTTVGKFARKFGIPIRPQRESLALSGGVRGERNPAWKGGIANWNYASGWKRIAGSIRKRDNYTCQMCGTQFPTTSKILHVHHKDGDKFNNSPDNLVAVCATCHPKGKRLEKWTRHKSAPDRQWVITRQGDVFGLDPSEWISTRAAAESIGVTAYHIVSLGKRGLFEIEKKGGFYYIRKQSFDTFKKTYKRGNRY